jgi:hypothetical protein
VEIHEKENTLKKVKKKVSSK